MPTVAVPHLAVVDLDPNVLAERRVFAPVLEPAGGTAGRRGPRRPAGRLTERKQKFAMSKANLCQIQI
ncbi:hypothetical protein [Halobaculum litoreum]|uniref:Uncharacterized protein n=1 Tax=Halobaculum litoreum TaxID=3031998 RepID=A0ABD5XNY5_9EURY|nr:hypothetical protein [Halobaculum sp. DT92]